MARTTTNYGFNISEGTDLVNPLTDIFPNFESLDTDLKNVSDATFGVATELKNGTVHALTRDDHDKTVFKFTATANFTAGDTFTLDGEQVSALTTAGEQLTTGCYIIGSEVIVAVKGTLLTFFISNVVTDASTLEGHDASYFATASELSETEENLLAVSNKVGSAVLETTAQDCSSAINELNTKGDFVELCTFTTTQNSVVVPSLSQFKYLLLAMDNNMQGNILGTTILPTSLFVNGFKMTTEVTWNGVFYAIEVDDIDDTHIKAYMVNGAWGGRLYGIK